MSEFCSGIPTLFGSQTRTNSATNSAKQNGGDVRSSGVGRVVFRLGWANVKRQFYASDAYSRRKTSERSSRTKIRPVFRANADIPCMVCNGVTLRTLELRTVLDY